MKFLASFHQIKRDREGETTLVLKIDASQSDVVAPLYRLDDMKLLSVEITAVSEKDTFYKEGEE